MTYANPREIWVAGSVREQAQILAVLHLDRNIQSVLGGIAEEVVDRVKITSSLLC